MPPFVPEVFSWSRFESVRGGERIAVLVKVVWGRVCWMCAEMAEGR